MWAFIAGCSQDADDTKEPGFVQREGSRLIKVQSVGLAAFGPINPHTADAALTELAFGEPSSAERSRGLCSKRWADLGLVIEFAARGAADSCGAEARIALIRLEGQAAAAAGWRTAEGIRPGMSVAAARRIYPEATRDRFGRLALVERLEGSGSVPPPRILVATTARGRISGLIFPIDDAD